MDFKGLLKTRLINIKCKHCAKQVLLGQFRLLSNHYYTSTVLTRNRDSTFPILDRCYAENRRDHLQYFYSELFQIRHYK